MKTLDAFVKFVDETVIFVGRLSLSLGPNKLLLLAFVTFSDISVRFTSDDLSPRNAFLSPEHVGSFFGAPFPFLAASASFPKPNFETRNDVAMRKISAIMHDERVQSDFRSPARQSLGKSSVSCCGSEAPAPHYKRSATTGAQAALQRTLLSSEPHLCKRASAQRMIAYNRLFRLRVTRSFCFDPSPSPFAA